MVDEAVFPAAAYFSMAMKATTRMTELGAGNVEIANYVLRDTSTEFASIQKITNNANHLLWVSDGGIMKEQRPEAAMVSSLMRAIRAKEATISIVTVGFDCETTPDDQASGWVSENAVTNGGLKTCQMWRKYT